ncbi:MAG TPA: hypothetical protein PLY93_04845 [Turneriella sp.]|nr:hypothetical protein [Turneriella sp.]
MQKNCFLVHAARAGAQELKEIDTLSQKEIFTITGKSPVLPVADFLFRDL